MTSVVKLPSGREMPMLGLGTWEAKFESDRREVEEAVKYAIDVGYRHIDGAALYGNEPEVGRAIAAKIKDGSVKREDLFVVSKLWNTKHAPPLVMPTLRKTLEDLGLDYIDLYLMHWPMGYEDSDDPFPTDEQGKVVYSHVDYIDTWKAMEVCVDAGLARDIGISNFSSKQIQRLLDSSLKMKPACNQVECHPYLNQAKLVQFCKDREIVLVAYAPLGSPARPFAKPDDPSLLEDVKLKAIAEKYGKSVAQVCLRYQLDRGVAVIPKSSSPKRIKENFDVADFSLTPKEMEIINQFDMGPRGRLFDDNGTFPVYGRDHPYWAFHDEF